MVLTIYMGMFVVLACIDMGIKQYIEDTFEENEERETILPRVVLRKVHNRGFAFNVLERAPDVIRKSSLCAAAGIFFYDIWMFTRKKRAVGKVGMALASAGAVSNLYDRLIRKKVIDYVGVKSERDSVSKLTANLADMYLTAGALLCGISGLAHRKRRKKI